MTTFASLKGAVRQERGKGPNRRLRAKGILPGVVYNQTENVSMTTNPIELNRILDKSGINTLIDLTLEGDSVPKRTVLLKEAQMHPYRDEWIHADFFEINLKEKLKVNVPIRLLGHSPGEKQGGIVEHYLHDLEIECYPGDIPDAIEVNMAQVELDQVVHVSDLSVPVTAEVLNDPQNPVVSVHQVKVVEDKPEGEEGEEAAAAAGEAKAGEDKKEEG